MLSHNRIKILKLKIIGLLLSDLNICFKIKCLLDIVKSDWFTVY